jgi:exopolysaccharide biosynthesis polyprenyl glycosylphosphotransferase
LQSEPAPVQVTARGQRTIALLAVKPPSALDPQTPTRPSGHELPLPPARADIRARSAAAPVQTPILAFVRRLASIASLILLDLSALALGLYAAFVLRALYYGETPLLWGALWRATTNWLPFLALVTVLVFWQARLYAERERRTGMGRIASSLVLVTLIALAFGIGTGHEFSTFGLFPTALVTTAIGVGLLRASYETLSAELLRMGGVRRRAILVGDGDALFDLRRKLGSTRSGIDYEFLGALTRSRDGVGLPVLGDLDALERVLEQTKVNELIVSNSELTESELVEIVEQAHRQGVKVRVAPSTAELLIQRGEYVPGQGLPLFELRPPVFAGTDWVVKRTFDYAVSIAVVVLGLPLWLAIAAAIKLTSRGPVLYRDRRVGVGEREFAMLKFRTMRAEAPRLQPALEAANEAEGPLFKIRRDPRVTGVGAILRRLSLDEVPQVLNVLRGEMSLVGPRPLPLRDYAQLDGWHLKRYLVLPGMTGLWQISGRSNLGFDDLVRLDFYYLENWSIWLDISILLKTIPAVFAGRGAY